MSVRLDKKKRLADEAGNVAQAAAHALIAAQDAYLRAKRHWHELCEEAGSSPAPTWIIPELDDG